MKLLTNIIIEYLKHNKRLVVPKLGAFIVKRQGGEIIFSELMRGDDGVLRSLLMAYGMKELEANGTIDRMVFEIRHAVGKGESYLIEDLGDFRPGANNTIVFRHHREPLVIGGNIKPPVETLNDEKIKMQRMRKHQPQPAADHKRRSKRVKVEAVREPSEDIMSITKPDKYLRGLKYDQKKNKKREEDLFRSTPERHTTRNVLMRLIAAIIVGIAGWFVWQELNKPTEAMLLTPELSVESPAEVAVPDTLVMQSAVPELQDTTTTQTLNLINQ